MADKHEPEVDAFSGVATTGHDEDPALPGYTPEGDAAGNASVLAARSWSTGNPFATAPIHLMQLLGPRIREMGADDSVLLDRTSSNPLLTGKIVHRGNTYDGEHEAIVDLALFERVRQQLLENGRTGGLEMRNKYGALLRGLLRCKKCDCAMIHTFYGKRNKQYRYYRCLEAIKNGAHTCEASSLPGLEIEKLVVDEIRTLGGDRELLDRILAEAQVNVDQELAALETERASIHASLGRLEQELRELVADRSGTAAATARLAAAHERGSGARTRLAEVEARLGLIGANAITREEARKALNEFDGVWSQLSPREQGRVLKLLFSKIEYDAQNATVAVTFRATGIAALCARRLEEAA